MRAFARSLVAEGECRPAGRLTAAVGQGTASGAAGLVAQGGGWRQAAGRVRDVAVVAGLPGVGGVREKRERGEGVPEAPGESRERG